MLPSQRAPAGPRGAIGAAAESAAADYLETTGWTVLARNLRVGRDEIDVLARDPGAPSVIVVVEVRARSRPGFGAPVETVDTRKVRRLYRAAWALHRDGHPALDAEAIAGARWRVDLVTLRWEAGSGWQVERHLRGLHPP